MPAHLSCASSWLFWRPTNKLWLGSQTLVCEGCRSTAAGKAQKRRRQQRETLRLAQENVKLLEYIRNVKSTIPGAAGNAPRQVQYPSARKTSWRGFLHFSPIASEQRAHAGGDEERLKAAILSAPRQRGHSQAAAASGVSRHRPAAGPDLWTEEQGSGWISTSLVPSLAACQPSTSVTP